MAIEIKTYKEWLSIQADASAKSGDIGGCCFVAGCANPPPYYRVGDVRFRCGMCEIHAGMQERYISYVESQFDKLKTQNDIDKL